MSARLVPPVGPKDHAQGPDDAPVMLVEYGDFECPHCARAHPIVKAVQRWRRPRPKWAAGALLSGLFAERVREDFLSGVKRGVNGTPTFFVNGVRHDGSWDAVSLLEALTVAAARP